MSWIFLALLSAFGDALLVLLRKTAAPGTPPYELALVQLVPTAIVFAAVLPFAWKASMSYELWGLIAIRSVLNAAAVCLLFAALRSDAISKVMPITALSPAITIVIDALWTGYTPSRMGFAGVIVSCVGVFWLMRKAKQETGSYLTRGVVPIILVTVIWSIETVIHGVVMRSIPPIQYLGISQALVLCFVLLWGVTVRQMRAGDLMRIPWRHTVSLGGVNVFILLTLMYAQSLALAGYVSAIKRTSILFAVVLGWMFLGEKIRERIVPIMVTVCGAVLVIMGSR